MIIDFRVGAPIKSARGRPHKMLYNQLYHFDSSAMESYIMSPEELLQLLDNEGIDRVVIMAEDNETTFGTKIPNEKLAEFCKKDLSRFIGFAGADPHKGMAGVRQLEYAIKELGLKGLNLVPFMQKLFPTDRKYYPLFAKCVELDIPVTLHTSIQFSLEIPMDYSHPKYIDEVATDFPELKIVASHGGWPWVTEMVAVAWRRPNVYIDIAAQRPKYMGLPASGWAPLLQFGNSILQDRILFATRYPLLPFRRTVEEFHQLPLKNEVKEKWLWKNAARLLKLE
jgi:predicted TIM-barrel fold metal-dependent hydrolase